MLWRTEDGMGFDLKSIQLNLEKVCSDEVD